MITREQLQLIIDKHRLQVEGVKDDIIVETLRQIINSKDVKLVDTTDGRFGVYYVPGSGMEDLRNENTRLQAKLNAYERMMEQHGIKIDKEEIKEDE